MLEICFRVQLHAATILNARSWFNWHYGTFTPSHVTFHLRFSLNTSGYIALSPWLFDNSN